MRRDCDTCKYVQSRHVDDGFCSKGMVMYDHADCWKYREAVDPAVENKKLRRALEFINDTAPPMYEYNEVEMRMVLAARKALGV